MSLKPEILRKLKAKASGLNRWIEIVLETDNTSPNYPLFCQVLANYIKTMEALFRVIKKSA
ncbi:unnamed protein product [marine sediment metagenome]|uniref:Uncharacterized protein n=1 Tax=marine sediment metagenome TaxID=412755 RepID=X1KHU1_9ZZZZ